MRHDHRDARPYVIALVQRHVPDRDAGDVGNGIQGSGCEHAGRETDVARARPSFVLRRQRRNDAEG